MLIRRLAPLALLGLLALASQASAQAVPDGSGTLTGRDRLRIPGCGREAGPISVDVTLAANGAWTADVGAVTYGGTSTQVTRRLARLTLDAGSLTPAFCAARRRRHLRCGLKCPCRRRACS